MMSDDEERSGWKYGLCCICVGIVCVMSMGVFSLLYYGSRIGKIL